MSYTPTKWTPQVEITSALLNKLENGVANSNSVVQINTGDYKDANDIPTGTYYLAIPSNSLPTHFPSDVIGYGILVSQINPSKTNGKQIYTDLNGRTYTRLKASNNWADFKQTSAGSLDNAKKINGVVFDNKSDISVLPVSADKVSGDSTFKELLTNKAHYTPWEFVKFSAIANSNAGTIHVEYYKREELKGSQDFAYSQSMVEWMWQLPGDDVESYIAKITNTVNDHSTTVFYAMNVSWNIDDLPIMGFLSKFGEDDPNKRKEILKYLNRLHINYVQFYDWFDRHGSLLPSLNGGYDDCEIAPTYWTDFVRRPTRFGTIYNYIQDLKAIGARSMAYGALNGVYTNENVEGISDDMFLYNDNSHNKNNIFNSNLTPWAKYTYYQTNWMNPNWQRYATDAMKRVFRLLPFDGWHIDMFGDPGDKYDDKGQQLSSPTLENGIHYFLDYVGKNFGVPMSINSVAEYGQTDISKSHYTNYLYTEVWGNAVSYDNLFSLMNHMLSYKDDQNNTRGLIIAGYMHHDWSNNGNNNSNLVFDDAGVILTDLLIASSGASHLEMGEHMLTTEYFPNDKLAMSDNLKSTLVKINDLMVAYKRLFKIRKDSSHAVWSNTHNLSINSMEKGKISVIEREDDWYKVVALINMNGLNGDDWRDDNKNRNQPTTQTNVRIGIPNYDSTVYKHFYVVTLDDLVPREVHADSNNSFVLDKLDYYTLVYATKY